MDIYAWESFLERRVREAQDEGKFENLRGAGKPLHLKNNPFRDSAWGVLEDVLAEANLVPDWVKDAREIDGEHQSICEALERFLKWCREGEVVLAERHDIAAHQERNLLRDERRQAHHRFSEAIEEINKRINNFNLKVPSVQLQRTPLNLQRELERIKRRRPVNAK